MSGVDIIADNLCPICGMSLDAFDERAANHHVNSCMDAGSAPKRSKLDSEPTGVTGAWQRKGIVHSSTIKKDAPSLEEEGFTLATLNVWFERHYVMTRYSAQFNFFEKELPTFIVLQEVTQPYWYALKQLHWVATHYHLVGEEPQAPGSYAVCILSRVAPVAASVHRLSTRMGRSVVRVQCPGGLTVFTTHLESMSGNASTRARQLRQLDSVLRGEAHCVLAGDFNFCGNADLEEHAAVPAFLRDAVSEQQRGERAPPMTIGVTYPSSKWPSKRFDRVMYRSSVYSAASVRHFGAEKLDILPQELRQNAAPRWVRARGAYMSDHLGIIVSFAKTAQSVPEKEEKKPDKKDEKQDQRAKGAEKEAMRRKRLARFERK